MRLSKNFLLVVLIESLSVSLSISQTTVISPRAGEHFVAGKIHNIVWNRGDYEEKLNISLWDGRNSCWSIIAQNISSYDNQYTWKIPENLVGDRFRIRVDYLSTGRYQMTNSYFSIDPKVNSLTVNSTKILNNGRDVEVWPNPASKSFSISWTGRVNRIIIRDETGREVKQLLLKTTDQAKTIENLGNGTYLLECYFKEGDVLAKKVVVLN